jgi:hypothetical protein
MLSCNSQRRMGYQLSNLQVCAHHLHTPGLLVGVPVPACLHQQPSRMVEERSRAEHGLQLPPMYHHNTCTTRALRCFLPSLLGATGFEEALKKLVRDGGALTSSALRSMLAPAATVGLGAIARRSLQDDFDGAVSCLVGLLEAYGDLSGLLGRLAALLVSTGPHSSVEAAATAAAEAAELLQSHNHVRPFEERGAVGVPPVTQGGSVLDASLANIGALQASLAGWEGRRRSHQEPSRVVRWAAGP